MDDQSRSIIRNVKGPGMLTRALIDPSARSLTWVRQSVRTISSASSSPSVKPAGCDKQCVDNGEDYEGDHLAWDGMTTRQSLWTGFGLGWILSRRLGMGQFLSRGVKELSCSTNHEAARSTAQTKDFFEPHTVNGRLPLSEWTRGILVTWRCWELLRNGMPPVAASQLA